MIKTTLYRKYRPSKFKDVVGQDHIVEVIQNEIKNEKISHAYLFSGSRGTGKTSIARIIARELGVSSNDIYEIDAASNRGIDDIREIRESVQSLPFDSEYKVYIVDEVHMLTKEAFNALLKTLEEPPEHVIFILATTEFEKIPETIVSRCETYQFKQPTQIVLKKVVGDIAKKEGYELEPSSKELIALLGGGSFRDTLGVLQKVINASDDKKIDPEEVERVVGAPKIKTLQQFIEAVLKKDSKLGLESIKTASSSNIDMKMFLIMVLERMRYILLIRFGSKDLIKDEVSEDEMKFLEKLAEEKDLKLTSEILIRFIDAQNQMSISNNPSLPLELALLDICE